MRSSRQCLPTKNEAANRPLCGKTDSDREFTRVNFPPFNAGAGEFTRVNPREGLSSGAQGGGVQRRLNARQSSRIVAEDGQASPEYQGAVHAGVAAERRGQDGILSSDRRRIRMSEIVIGSSLGWIGLHSRLNRWLLVPRMRSGVESPVIRMELAG